LRFRDIPQCCQKQLVVALFNCGIQICNDILRCGSVLRGVKFTYDYTTDLFHKIYLNSTHIKTEISQTIDDAWFFSRGDKKSYLAQIPD
jgi:hypothetical protein